MEIVVDGRRIFAATGGNSFDPARPTVVFIHGAGMDHTVWNLQTRWFAHHGRNAMAIDLPGHGHSEGPALISIETMADFVPRLLDAVGAERAALVGHSMGALVSLAVAARHGARVRALALIGAAALMPVHAKLLDAAARGDHAAIDMISDWAFGRRAQLGGAKAPGTWMVGGGVRLLERSAAGVLANDLAACDAYKGGLAAAEAADCPILYLLGSADRMTPASGARALISASKDARERTLAGVGHMAMIEAPDATLDALAEIC